jgi:hypothetical protein
MSIRHIQREKDAAFCGQLLTSLDWAFVDYEHAALSIEQETYIQPCQRCVDKAREMMRPADSANE